MRDYKTALVTNPEIEVPDTLHFFNLRIFFYVFSNRAVPWNAIIYRDVSVCIRAAKNGFFCRSANVKQPG